MYIVYSSLETDEPIMLLNQPIGVDKDDPYAPYIDGALFQSELLELDTKGYKCIKIHINSPGGNVIEGYNICNAILKSKTPVDTYNVGIAASMAAAIFMTGRKRVMADYATFMIHNPFGGEDQKMLTALKQSCLTIISGKCKISEEEVGKMMDKETWLSPSECLEKGFCTDIEATNAINQHRMPKASIRAMWKEANEIQNNILNSKNMADTTPQSKAIGLSLVASYIGLHAEASESSVLDAVKGKINNEILARTKAEEALASANGEKKKLQDEIEDLKSKLGEKEKELKTMKDAEAQAKKEAEDKVKMAEADAAKVSAKATIEAYAKGPNARIKAEQVDKYVDLAIKTSLQDVKDIIEAMPINKAAVSAQAAAAQTGGNAAAARTAGEAVDPNQVPANSMTYMARVQANMKVKTA